MKKMKKVLSIFLCVLLIASVGLVSSFAAAPKKAVSMVVKTPPSRTVFYDGVDNVLFGGNILVFPLDAVLTVTYSDGTQEDVIVTQDVLAEMYVDAPTLGENIAEINYYLTNEKGQVVNTLTATCPVIFKETPVASVEITKLPNKLVYDMDKDVITRENVSIDKLYALNPDAMDDILAMEDSITFEEYKAYLEAHPEEAQAMYDKIFSVVDALLMLDFSGAEFTVHYKDGSKEELCYDDGYNVYNNVLFPILSGQEDTTVVEGDNKVSIIVMGVEAPFTVEVKKNVTPSEPETKPETEVKPDANQKPVTPPADVEIPKTGNSVSTSTMGAVALVSALGAAYVLSKKVK